MNQKKRNKAKAEIVTENHKQKQKKKKKDSKSDGPAKAGPFFVGGKKIRTSKIKAKKGRKKQKK